VFSRCLRNLRLKDLIVFWIIISKHSSHSDTTKIAKNTFRQGEDVGNFDG